MASGGGEGSFRKPPGSSDKAGPTGDHINKYCCCLHKRGGAETGTHGNGFIVDFRSDDGKLQPPLLALQLDRFRNLEPTYALITAHRTIPSLSSVSEWTISCPGIRNGELQKLSELVCGVISCCGPESLLANPGHGHAKAVSEHTDVSVAKCDLKLNVTVLFLNKSFEMLLDKADSPGRPFLQVPVVPVQQCLDQDACATNLQKMIKDGSTAIASKHKVADIESHCVEPFEVYYCDGARNLTAAAYTVSVIEHSKPQCIPQHERRLSHKIGMYEWSQKVYYRESGTTSKDVLRKCCGSPLVYHGRDAEEPTLIGVHVGESERPGEFVAATLHGIIQLLRGGPVPVLSILQLPQGPRFWPSRWAYLLTSHLEDTEEPVECSYLCEILHCLLKDRLGTQLVELKIPLPDVENNAALDLLCLLFKHLNSDHAVIDTALKGIFPEPGTRKIFDDAIEQLCERLINLLKGAPDPAKRMTLIEKCCEFYSTLLDFTYKGISERMLHTHETLAVLEDIRLNCKSSAVVQGSIAHIYKKCYNILDEKHRRLEEIAETVQKQGLKEQSRQAEKFAEERAELERQRAEEKDRFKCQREKDKADFERQREGLVSQNLQLQTEKQSLQARISQLQEMTD